MMTKEFEMSMIGELSYFLGLKSSKWRMAHLWAKAST
jgi:hypothetical protein